MSSSGPRETESEIEVRDKSRRDEEGRPRVIGVNGRILHLDQEECPWRLCAIIYLIEMFASHARLPQTPMSPKYHSTEKLEDITRSAIISSAGYLASECCWLTIIVRNRMTVDITMESSCLH